MSTIRTNSITDAAGTGAPDFPNGIEVADGQNILIGIDSGDPFNSQARLRIQGGGSEYIQIKGDGTGTLGLLFGDATDDFLAGILSSQPENNLIFHAGNAERVRIAETGFVGIGTSAPASTLDVNGTITAGTLRLPATGDVSLASTGHAFQIGTDTSFNLAMDNNEIQARNNGAAGALSLNADGGNVNIGSAGASVNVEGTLAIQGSVTGLPAPTTAQVGSATAGLAVDSVGSYALLYQTTTNTARAPGATVAGSTLRFTSCAGFPQSVAASGTWRIMGALSSTTAAANSTSLWLRIS